MESSLRTQTYFRSSLLSTRKVTSANPRGKEAAVHRLRPFNFEWTIHRARSCEKSRELWLIMSYAAAARVRKRYFSSGEKRRPQIRLCLQAKWREDMCVKFEWKELYITSKSRQRTCEILF